METPQEQLTAEQHQAALLEKINAPLQELSKQVKWLGGKWIKLPESLPEYEKLKGKRILLVDDAATVIGGLLPQFMVATDGNFSFIQYKGEDVRQLIEEIIAKSPEILLLDYNLSEDYSGEGLKGTDVANALQENAFEGKMVGFSSEKSSIEEFQRRSGIVAIEKNTFSIEDSLKELSKVI